MRVDEEGVGAVMEMEVGSQIGGRRYLRKGGELCVSKQGLISCLIEQDSGSACEAHRSCEVAKPPDKLGAGTRIRRDDLMIWMSEELKATGRQERRMRADEDRLGQDETLPYEPQRWQHAREEQ